MKTIKTLIFIIMVIVYYSVRRVAHHFQWQEFEKSGHYLFGMCQGMFLARIFEKLNKSKEDYQKELEEQNREDGYTT